MCSPSFWFTTICNDSPKGRGQYHEAAASGQVPEQQIPPLEEVCTHSPSWSHTGPGCELRAKILIYTRDPKQRNLQFRRLGQYGRFQLLSRTAPWSYLKPWHRLWLSRANLSQLKTVIEVYQAIEDCFVLTFPEFFMEGDETYHPTLLQVWKWTIAHLTNSRGRQAVTKMWKALVAHIKGAAVRSIRPLPPLIPGTIFTYDGDLVLPASMERLELICESGIQSKDEGTLIMHFCSTRGLPAPSRSLWGDELNAHGARITSTFEVDPTIVGDLEFIGHRLAAICRSRLPTPLLSAAHVSLSDSACAGNSRRAGGRATAVGRSFIQWLTEKPAATQEGFTHFGERFWEVAGIYRFRTMCRKDLYPYEDFIRSNDPSRSDEMEFNPFTGEYINQVNGLDDRIGYQLLQWSIDQGIALHRLLGPRFLMSLDYTGSLDASQRLVPNPAVLPEIIVNPIGEPGGKVRTITVGEDWLTVFLSPMGHDLLSCLRAHPSARAGISAAAQAYEYVKEVGPVEPGEETWFLTSDLTQASEMLVRPYSYALLTSFASELGMLTSYMLAAIQLLCHPRLIIKANGATEYQYIGYRTTRGCLMGDPGTKAALTLTMLAAEEIAYRRYCARSHPHTWMAEPPACSFRAFRNSGDDHIARGPHDYCVAIDNELVRLGAELVIEKAYLSKIGCYYSEELIINLPSTIWSAGRLDSRPYLQTAHVDSIKIRLFSPASKLTVETRDEKNPAIGKWAFLSKKIDWLPKSMSYLREIAKSRFRQRFRPLIDWEDVFTYLPEQFGGLGFPLDDRTALLGQVDLLPRLVRAGLYAIPKPKCPYEIRACLRSYRTNTSYRGGSIDERIMSELRFAYTQNPCSLTREQIVERLRLQDCNATIDFSSIRGRFLHDLAGRIGFIPLCRVIEELNRPTYFKQVLTGESCILQNLQSCKDLKEIWLDMDEYFEESDLTLCEARLKDPSMFANVDACLARYATEAWAIQSDYQRRTDPCDLVQTSAETKSFNTTPWPVRRTRMLKLLRRNWPETWPIALASEDSMAFIKALDSTLERGPDFRIAFYDEDIYVPRELLHGLCTLSTPLGAEPSIFHH